MERPVSLAALSGAALIAAVLAGVAARIPGVPPVAAIAPPASATGHAVVTLERGACYGRCPVFSVSVTEAGHVEFQGARFTCTTVPQSAEVDPAQARALVAAMRAAGFAAWPQFDRFDMTDQATATITLADDGTSHRVVHYRGMLGVPPAVSDVERRIAQTAGVSRWLPVERPGGHLACRQPDGSELPVADDF